MRKTTQISAVIGAICLVWATSAEAEQARIALWNGQELFDRERVETREDDIRRFCRTVQPDVLVIDEVCSRNVVLAVALIMRSELNTGYLHIACSDFNQTDDDQYASFEVGIISRYPLTQVVEYDISPDNQPYGRRGEPAERLLTADSLLKLGLDKADPGRGFLWARIDQLKLTLCATHLKSSRSGSDLLNAMQREYVAGAMALSVNEDKRLFPEHTHLVIGDLNVGFTDQKKNGKDLDEDVEDPGAPGDRYDETHALLGGGLVEGLKMKNLTAGVGETYDDTRFTGSGPIDNIYVTGPREAKFQAAEKSNSTFGSDHFAVHTDYERP